MTSILQEMEDNLNFTRKWKTTSIFQKWKMNSISGITIGVHLSPLELEILYVPWWSPLELMELVESVPKKDLH
jgi:hypothetical protein